MALNPNVPYEVYQNGKYVSLSSTSASHSLVTPLILTTQYKEFEEKFSKLSYDTRETLGKVAWAATPSRFNKTQPEDPLAGMSAARRDMVIADLKKHGVGWVNEQDKTFGLDADGKTIVRDLRGGKKGFNTPVYSVAGKPVVSEHFDDAGNLAKGVAKIYGVPSAREEAIAARAPGVRKELLQVAPARPTIPTAAR